VVAPNDHSAAATAARPNAPLGRRLREARAALGGVHHHARRLLAVRRDRIAERIRSAAWAVAGTAAMVVVAVLVASAAAILVMLGSASLLADWLGMSPAAGGVVVGAAVLALFALALARGKATRDGDLDIEEGALCRAIRDSVRALLRALGTGPTLALSTALGFVAFRSLRGTRWRRLVILGSTALRTADRLSRPQPAATPVPAGQPAGSGPARGQESLAV